jgi:hypothetical protein
MVVVAFKVTSVIVASDAAAPVMPGFGVVMACGISKFFRIFLRLFVGS